MAFWHIHEYGLIFRVNKFHTRSELANPWWDNTLCCDVEDVTTLTEPDEFKLDEIVGEDIEVAIEETATWELKLPGIVITGESTEPSTSIFISSPSRSTTDESVDGITINDVIFGSEEIGGSIGLFITVLVVVLDLDLDFEAGFPLFFCWAKAAAFNLPCAWFSACSLSNSSSVL